MIGILYTVTGIIIGAAGTTGLCAYAFLKTIKKRLW